MSAVSVLAATAFTGALYYGSVVVQGRLGVSVPNPLFTAVVLGGLLFALLPPGWLEAYLAGSWALRWLLGPATAALALPFFRRRAFLAEHPRAVVLAVLAGCTSTLATVWALGAALRMPAPLLGAASLKSVTLPVALGLAQLVHTHPGITTVCVFTSGLLGGAIGPALLTRARVRSPVARGLALGTLSHAIGTARALEEDPVSGAAGVVALTLSALLIAAGAIAVSMLVR